MPTQVVFALDDVHDLEVNPDAIAKAVLCQPARDGYKARGHNSEAGVDEPGEREPKRRSIEEEVDVDDLEEPHADLKASAGGPLVVRKPPRRLERHEPHRDDEQSEGIRVHLKTLRCTAQRSSNTVLACSTR
eukprot:scaffold26345_cov70-Phaeocystis_antarctica.AAC.1